MAPSALETVMDILPVASALVDRFGGGRRGFIRAFGLAAALLGPGMPGECPRQRDGGRAGFEIVAGDVRRPGERGRERSPRVDLVCFTWAEAVRGADTERPPLSRPSMAGRDRRKLYHALEEADLPGEKGRGRFFHRPSTAKGTYRARRRPGSSIPSLPPAHPAPASGGMGAVLPGLRGRGA